MLYETRTYPYVFLFTLLLFSSLRCTKQEDYPIEPSVTFKDFVIQGDSAKLVFEFTDGDGDLGLDDTAILPPFDPNSYYHYNLYLRYFEKDATNNWKPGVTLSGDTLVFRYRVKPFTTTPQGKGIKGTMEVSLSPYFYNPLSATNSHVKFTIELIDRSLNKSNLEETPEIIR